MEGQSDSWGVAKLAKCSGRHADALQIADATIAVWSEINTALGSIIGMKGVSALYDRSLALTTRSYSWLGISRASSDHSMELDKLHAVIAQQNAQDAAAGVGELLQTLHNVLASLIGPALCNQLLVSVRGNFTSQPLRDAETL